MDPLNAIKGLIRKRTLAKNGSKIPTRIMPLKDIHTAVTFIDVEDTSFDKCKEAILSFYRENNIQGDIFFFDFRKIGKDELLITSINTTILKKDINWYGRPSKDNIAVMLERKPDIFISLVNTTDFPIAYMATCCEAQFKVGRKQLPGEIYDFVVTGKENSSQLDIFNSVKQYLRMIQ